LCLSFSFIYLYCVILSYVLYCSSLQYLMCLLLCCMIVRSCCVACLFFLHHLQSTFTTLYILLLKSLERKKTPSSLIPPLPWVCLPPRATLSIHWKKNLLHCAIWTPSHLPPSPLHQPTPSPIPFHPCCLLLSPHHRTRCLLCRRRRCQSPSPHPSLAHLSPVEATARHR
jgi:hypothetical protein